MKNKKINQKKLKKTDIFDKLSNEWWDLNGAFKALHSYNFVRIDYVKNIIFSQFGKSYKNLNLLDVGCGGGILCEPLSRIGFKVIGIDENQKAIEVAVNHSKDSNLKINYINSSVEKHKFKEKFNIITCMEVIEHVENLENFIISLKKNLKPGGIIIGSTINKSLSSYIFAKFFAENILKIVPQGTHQWKMFIKTNYLKKELFSNGFSKVNFQGVIYNPLINKWKLINSCKVNYMFAAFL
ncbi:MAG: Ubiquinone biosynthesis O-methyltransferase [Alphaproteobacteria bacterium MarineAlpha8_Bin1]|nr:MAG: Ubiquinone biosynthesis O-methyltransferase [Alphaproteobacteria bacterium MarineAlpha8_Bin1]|tara:strand:- start:88 stop:807 length:720 start_codon:yes stop_codon:yes gene_type:complete